MNKKSILIVVLIAAGILLAVLFFFLASKKKNFKVRELYFSNIEKDKTVVSFFTDEEVKSCVLAVNLLKGTKKSCFQEPSKTHYHQLSELKPSTKYQVVIFLNNKPFFNFWKQKVENEFEEEVPTADKIKIEKSWEKKKNPVLKLANEDLTKRKPFVVKGTVNGIEEKAVIIFKNFSSSQVLSTITNWQGNFIIDVSSLTPMEKLYIQAREGEKEEAIVVNAEQLFGNNLHFNL